MYHVIEEESDHNATPHTATTTHATTNLRTITTHVITTTRNKRRNPFLNDITETPFLSNGKP